jgi:hypothetical protein
VYSLMENDTMAPFEEKQQQDQPQTFQATSREENHDNNKQEQQQEQQQQESNIQKAKRFWDHRSVRDVPAEQKRAYLHERGVTDEQIQMAWERIVAEPTITATTNDVGVVANTTAQGPPLTNSSRVPYQPQQHQQPYGSYHQNTPPYTTGAGAHAAGGSMYPNHNSEDGGDDDGSLTFAQGATLVTLGGALGLTAAAAVRWLNGGDFKLFPSPKIQPRRIVLQEQPPQTAATTTTTTALPPTIEEMQEEGDEYEDDDDDGEYDHSGNELLEQGEEYDGEIRSMQMQPPATTTMQEQLLAQVQVLSNTMRSHVTFQEKLLQKITTNSSSITDHSMNLLRNSTTNGSSRGGNNNNNNNLEEQRAVRTKLVEIKAELTSLGRIIIATTATTTTAAATNTSNNGEKAVAWEQQLTRTLTELDACLKTMSRVHVDSDDYSVVGGGGSQPSASVTTQMSCTTEEEEAAAAAAAASSTLTPPSRRSSSAPPSTPTTGPTTTTFDSAKQQQQQQQQHEQQQPTPPLLMSLREAVCKLAQENETTALRIGAQLLYLYIVNLSGRPDNPRYQKIYTCNESFQKVETLIGGMDLLFAVGFQEQQSSTSTSTTGNLEWQLQADDVVAMTRLKEAAAALSILKSTSNKQPTEDLVASALNVLSPEQPPLSPLQVFVDDDVLLQTPAQPPPSTDDDGNYNDALLQTPAGSSLLSPPMTKKQPYVPSPDTPNSSVSSRSNDTPQRAAASDVAAAELSPIKSLNMANAAEARWQLDEAGGEDDAMI